MRRLAAVLLLSGAILASCSSDDGDGGSAANTSIPDPTTTAPTSTEAATVAPDIIPADESRIDEAYVQAVLDELYRVSGEAIADAVENGTVTERSLELLEASHEVAAAVDQINSLAEADDGDFVRYVEDPGFVHTEVVELLSVDLDCVIAEISVDSTEVLAAPPDSTGIRTFVQLLPITEEQRNTGLNPTAWIFGDSQLTFEGEGADLPCP